MGRVNLLTVGTLSGSIGAERLVKAITDPLLNPRPAILPLPRTDDEPDTLRPYLAKHLNLEGKTGRKAWSNVRTFRENLRAMFVDRANKHNQANAEHIRASEHHRPG